MEGGPCSSVFVLLDSLFSDHQAELYEIKVELGSGKVARRVEGLVKEVGDGESEESLELSCVTKFFERKQLGVSVPESYLLTGMEFNGGSSLVLFAGARKKSSGPPFQPALGFIYNTESRSLLRGFPAPKSYKPYGILIQAYEKMYYLGSPRFADPPCECYTPGLNKWENLPPIPPLFEDVLEIFGYAVYNDHILVSFGSRLSPGGFRFVAFNVGEFKWKDVKANISAFTRQHYPFHGRGVVLGNRIYASSSEFGEVVEFQFDPVSYSISSNFSLAGLKRVFYRSEHYGRSSEYMVHLGGSDFCLVQTAYDCVRVGRQPLWISTFRIVLGSRGNYIKTLDSACFDVSMPDPSWDLDIDFCFTDGKGYDYGVEGKEEMRHGQIAIPSSPPEFLSSKTLLKENSFG